MRSLKALTFTVLALFVVSVAFLILAQREPEVIETTKVVTLEVEAEPEEPYYNITSVERELLARLIWAESRGEPEDCQQGIVTVIFNRATSCQLSISDVIYAKSASGTPQFSTASMLDSVTPTEQQYECVDYVVWNGPTMPSWVQYFRANKHHDWSSKYVEYCVIGNTYFGGFTE